jgi:hypothetical protein
MVWVVPLSLTPHVYPASRGVYWIRPEVNCQRLFAATFVILSSHTMPAPSRGLLAIIGLIGLATVVYASTGDRNPTFQQCLKGCRITYCDPSQPPIPAYLRAFGWTCEDNCRYQCGHAFTDMIRTGSRYHQCRSFSLAGVAKLLNVLADRVSLWQMGILPPRTYPRAFLGAHVDREFLGTLARVQGSQAQD